MSQQKLIDSLTKKIVQKYKKIPHLVGIFLVGSAARNAFDEFSDIDVYILTEKMEKISRESYCIGRVEIEVLFDTPESLEKFLTDERGSLYRNTANMIAGSKILSGETKKLVNFQEIAKSVLASKTVYDDEDIFMHKYSIADFLEDARRDAAANDAFNFAMDSAHVLRHIQELVMKICGEYYRKSREMKLVFKQIDLTLFQLMMQFYESKSILQKMILLDKLACRAYRLSGGQPSKTWSIKA